jgi:hypothetical protein
MKIRLQPIMITISRDVATFFIQKLRQISVCEICSSTEYES